MKRGQLRVLLGAAPGVGKTCAMLDEGRRLQDEGNAVVVAVVETHGRKATAAMLAGLEVVPRRHVTHRGVELSDMDLDGVLRATPDVALVDELAHTNAPGSRHAKRWEDVHELLDAGIDVISTVNIQHIESLNDVVRGITGIVQRETIPDAVLRKADQVELVDLPPEGLRARLSAGLIYPSERVDAAMSNYFRLGNLTALRELALLWLADNVDDALRDYRREHHIDAQWETRERVVVALAGASEGDTLIRRGARILARAGGGELIAVHVTSQDGVRSVSPGILAQQRTLVEQLGGTYHQIVGDDIAETLTQFARSIDATQLVIGVSRRTHLQSVFGTRGVGLGVIRLAGTIDVHIVSHAPTTSPSGLPRARGALSRKRRLMGLALTLVVGPLLSATLVHWWRSPDALTADALCYQVFVVVVAMVGGIWPALLAAIGSGLALNYFLVEPYHTLAITDPVQVTAILVYMLVAILVSVLVDASARRQRQASRAGAESEMIAAVAGEVLRQDTDPLLALAQHARTAFSLRAIRLMRGETTLVHEGDSPGPPTSTIRVDEDTILDLWGEDLGVSEQRLLGVIVAQLRLVLEHRNLKDQAKEIGSLEAANNVRSALLSAVGHDIRRPLAAATAAVTGLRAMGSQLSSEDRAELVGLAEESLGDLTSLVTELLDISRLNAGAYPVNMVVIDAVDAVVPALDELGVGPREVEIDLGSDVPLVIADPGLLRRALVNVLSNALQYASSNAPIRMTISSFADRVEIRVIDHGPGIPVQRRRDVFRPFQRLGDTDNTTGLGLGLALSRGFMEGMGGVLDIEDTPGGGTTMVLSLRCAPTGVPAGDSMDRAEPARPDGPGGSPSPEPAGHDER